MTDVVVVGAGLAGLQAARTLKQRGAEAVVLEARDRVGGRVLNEPLGDGQVIEVGGTWAGPTQTRILALAHELGVPTFKTYNAGWNVIEWRGELRRFYSTWFIPVNPTDVQMTEVSRTVGTDSLAFEFVATFTHSTEISWLLPGVAPTGRRIELAAVVIVTFDGDKLASEQIYWDQASVLVQVGLLERDGLPVVGVESARKVLDPTLPSNELITGGR